MIVEVDIIIEEQLAKVGPFACDDVVQCHVERRSQFGDNLGRELGKLLRVLGQIMVLVDLQPSMEEVAELELWPENLQAFAWPDRGSLARCRTNPV